MEIWLAKFWYRHSPTQTAHLTVPLDPTVDMMVQRFHPKWLYAENGKTYDRAFIEGSIEFECRQKQENPTGENTMDLPPVKFPGL